MEQKPEMVLEKDVTSQLIKGSLFNVSVTSEN